MEGQPESDTGQPLQSLLFFKTLHVPLLVGWWPKSGSSRLPDPRDLGGLGKPSFEKSAVFFNIVQKAFDPPPFYLNICPILQGVFFKRVFEI